MPANKYLHVVLFLLTQRIYCIGSIVDCNPLSNNDGFNYPDTPKDMDWTVHFPDLKDP